MANDTPSEALIPQLQPPTLPGVDSVERDNTDLTRAVYHLSRVNRPDNTSIAYNPKAVEFMGYCDAMYCHTGVNIWYQVTPEKVYNFLFYQSHCEKKKPGKGKRGERVKAGIFSPANYRIVVGRYANKSLSEWVPPTNPAQFQVSTGEYVQILPD